MTGPGDSSLITIAITSISGQRRTRTIVDRTMSMILFRNRPRQMADSARRPLSPSFELQTTKGSLSLVARADATHRRLRAGAVPPTTQSLPFNYVQGADSMDGFPG